MSIAEFKRAAFWLCCVLTILAPICVAHAAEFTEAILELHINSQPSSESSVVLRDDQGGLWLEEKDLIRLRIRVPAVAPHIEQGRRYFPLSAISGISVDIDNTTQRASVLVPANAFVKTSLSGEVRPPPHITPANWGGFINYDITGQRGNNQNFAGALTELGVFSPYGVFTNTASGTSLADNKRVVRLETSFTHDFTDTLHTLKLGDAINNPGSWGNAVRFAGVQWGTNFAIRPDLITAPLLSAAGEAVVPSTVDVFINHQQVSSQQVPPGPFVIDRLPTITGAGDVQVVVHDALGREQIITVPFYSGVNLLQAGLSQYSVEFGAIRKNFSLESNSYGSAMLSATYRRGLSDWFTVEGRAEALHNDAHAVGINVATRVGTLGVLGATLVNGGDAGNSGWLTGISAQRSGNTFSFTASTEVASDDFRQIGAVLGPFRSRTFAQTGINFGAAGTLSAAYGVQTYRDQPHQQIMSLTHSVSLRDVGYFSLILSRTRSVETASSALLIFTMPLSGMRSVSATARYDNELSPPAREVSATLQKNSPIGPGTGYRISASTAGNYDADWVRQFEPLSLELQAARLENVVAQRATLIGGGVFIGGDLYATRSVNDSFALVQVEGVPDLTVYVENQPIAHTDKNGRVLIRNLRPYEENKVGVDPTELPLDTTIAASTIKIAPMFRSGSIVTFPVKRERTATLTLALEDGKPVPAGAEVSLKGMKFPVALDGLVYLTGADHSMLAEADWNGGHCSFRLPAPPANDPLPDLGKVICRKTAR